MSDFAAYLAELRRSLDVSRARAEVIVAETVSHLEARAAELQEAGASRLEATQAAMQEFGDPKAVARALTRANGRHRRLRRVRRGLLLACCILIGGPSLLVYRYAWFRTHLTQNGEGIATRPPAASARRPKLASLPRFDPEVRNAQQLQLQGRDLRGLDLRDRLPDLLETSFSNRTQWPEALPPSFDPARIMETGRSPGLGVRALHRKGITGRGVGIAIIDQALLVDHKEYASRLSLYEELHSMERSATMHGAAVASIAVGKSVGVAPEADLYYIADSFMTSNPLPWVDTIWHRLRTRGDSPSTAARTRPPTRSDWDIVDFTWVARGIRRVLDINRRLPRERRIRVISIEIGWTPEQKGYREVTRAVAAAKQQGVFIISSSLSDTHGLRFHGLGRAPDRDPEDPASYSLVTDWGLGFERPTLLVPMDARTTAAPTGADDYVFYRHGGWSWAIPYIAGLYALACQVKPDVTPEVFWETALRTGTTPDYSAMPRIPRKALEQQAAAQYDAAVAAKQREEGAEGVRRLLEATHRKVTGKPLPKVSGSALRDLMIQVMADRDARRYAGREGRVVNPRGLVEALQNREAGAVGGGR